MHKPLVLPITAVPKSRRPVDTKHDSAEFSGTNDDEFETCSVATLDEDVGVLQETEEAEPIEPLNPTKRKRLDDNVMAFEPAELKHLPLTSPPAYASSMTTRRLQKDFMSLLAVQEEHEASGTLSDLGWYISPEQFESTGNLYQWICELHSFSNDLPLAKEMVRAKVNSIVLELRFHNTYPISPPFVRVIRPRFLPFASGGGKLIRNSKIESVLMAFQVVMSHSEVVSAWICLLRLAGALSRQLKQFCCRSGWRSLRRNLDQLDLILRTRGLRPTTAPERPWKHSREPVVLTDGTCPRS